VSSSPPESRPNGPQGLLAFRGYGVMRPLRRDGLQVRSPGPLVLHRVIDLSYPPAAVIARQSPRREAGTRLAIVLDLDLSWWVVPAFLE
jgi:hypothetical protein